tara:strand:+ start:127 stop:636 length:510 start_codon:yes stop_codon:yes gene_type:complete
MKFILKFILKKSIILILIIILTLNILYNKNFLSLKRALDYRIVDYNKDSKIFLNREYIDINNSDFLYKKKLIQINRHNSDNIYILHNSELKIYRPICFNNNNKLYELNWEIFDKKTNILGITCSHTNIYFKVFKNFLIKLEPGGPVSADPIFIDIKNEKGWFIVLNKKK